MDPKQKLQTARTQEVNEVDEVEPLLEKHVLLPQSDDYQTVLAGRLLEPGVLNTPAPADEEELVEGFGRVKPYSAPHFPMKVSEEVVFGPFPPPKPSVEVVFRVQSKLRESFIQLGRTAKVVDHRRHEETVGLDQLFVTLSSMSFEKAQAKFQERKNRSRALERSESTKDLKTFASRGQDEFELTSVRQLFRMRDGVETVYGCLVVGPAVLGKTLLLKKVAVSWAEEEAEELSEFEIVVLVNTSRDEEALKCDTPEEMLGCVLQRQFKLNNVERKEMEKYMDTNSEKVLVLLDTVNDGAETWAKSTALEMLIQRKALTFCTFVATSRPCSLVYDLKRRCRQQVYLIGFNDRRLDELLVRRLGEENGMDVAEKLKEPMLRHVRQLMKGTPLVANVVAELAAAGGASVLSCSTEIYKTIAAIMVQHQLHKVRGRSERRTDKDMFVCLPEDVKARLEQLGCLALTGIQRREFVFDMEEVVASCGVEVMDYGFLEEFEHQSVSQGPCHDVEFRHPTWLQFFAAYALSRMESPVRALASCAQVVEVGEERALFWKFVRELVDLKHLDKVLMSLKAAYFRHNSTEPDERRWVRLACRCIAEAVQQLPSAVSLEKELVFLKEASAAVIPSELNVSNSRLSVADAQTMSITLHHSPHVYSLDVSFCGLTAAHCQALGSGLTHIQHLCISGNPGLHNNYGLDMLADVIAEYGAPQLTHLYVNDSTLNIRDCAALRHLLNFATSLLELHISGNNFDSDCLSEFQEPLRKSQLENLNLDNNELNYGAGLVLADIVRDNKHLKYLHLAQNYLNNREVSDLLRSRGVTRSLSLQFMDFSNTDAVTDGVMDAVLTCLSKRARRLKTTGSLSVPPLILLFNKTCISRTAVEELVRNLPDGSKDRIECGSSVIEGGAVTNQSYRHFFEEYTRTGYGGCLDMHDEGIDDIGAEQIALRLKENSDVQALDLSHNDIGHAGVAALCDALRVNTTLRGLSMAETIVSAVRLNYIAAALASSNKTLQYVALCKNLVFITTSCVDVADQREALHQLVAMSGLRGLGLSDTGVGDVECEVIKNALTTKSCCLSVLLLGNNEISDKGAVALCSGLVKNKSIKYINLTENYISSEGAGRISQCLEYREKNGSPLRQVWMEGNLADPEVYTGCMVNGDTDFSSLMDFMINYL